MEGQKLGLNSQSGSKTAKIQTFFAYTTILDHSKKLLCSKVFAQVIISCTLLYAPKAQKAKTQKGLGLQIPKLGFFEAPMGQVYWVKISALVIHKSLRNHFRPTVHVDVLRHVL